MPKSSAWSLSDLVVQDVIDVFLQVLSVWDWHGVICSFAEDLHEPFRIVFEAIEQGVCIMILHGKHTLELEALMYK